MKTMNVLAHTTSPHGSYRRCGRTLKPEPAGFELNDDELDVFMNDPYIQMTVQASVDAGGGETGTGKGSGEAGDTNPGKGKSDAAKGARSGKADKSGKSA